MEPASQVISPKVKATAAAGAVVSAAVAVAALFGVEIEVSEEGLAAAGLVLTALVTLAGYLKRDPLRS